MSNLFEIQEIFMYLGTYSQTKPPVNPMHSLHVSSMFARATESNAM
jgi:hypothetical protein